MFLFRFLNLCHSLHHVAEFRLVLGSLASAFPSQPAGLQDSRATFSRLWGRWVIHRSQWKHRGFRSFCMSARKEKDALELVQKENMVMLAASDVPQLGYNEDGDLTALRLGLCLLWEARRSPAPSHVRSTDNCSCLLWNTMLRAQILIRWEMFMDA